MIFPIEVFVEILSNTKPLFDKNLDDFEYIKYLTEKYLIENKFPYEIVRSVRKPRKTIAGYEQKYITPVPTLLEESYVICVAIEAGKDKIHKIKREIEEAIRDHYENINVSVISPKYAPWLHKYLERKKIHSDEKTLEDLLNLLNYREPGKTEATV